MTAEQSFHVSVIDPIAPAIEKTKDILFRPFDLSRWFVIGFCAWLASLAQKGGNGFNFVFDFTRTFAKHQKRISEQCVYNDRLQNLQNFVTNNLPLALVIGAVVLLIAFAVSVVFLWLSGRGRFMFLDCVAQNKAEVKNPWHRFRMQGNSLFLFQFVVGIVAFICLIFCVAVVVAAAIALRIYKVKMMIVFIPLLVLMIAVFILLFVVFGVVLRFTTDFVAPIMYLRNCTCMEGWRQFLKLLSGNKGRFILYLLFQIVIGMAIGVIVLAATCLTCCIACCIMAIPYIGTVLLLPILVFQRAYSLMYLRQYGSQFDAFVLTANLP
jgi:hypothetical protein